MATFVLLALRRSTRRGFLIELLLLPAMDFVFFQSEVKG
jgi:hypothetical protein